MSSQFKCEFELKQVTPMIHFQSEQKGATLRATEVKPKLDQFITELVNRQTSSDKVSAILDRFCQESESKELVHTALKSLQNKDNLNYYLKNADGENHALNYKLRVNIKSGENLSGRYPVIKRINNGQQMPVGDYFVVERKSEDKTSFYSSANVSIMCFQKGLLKLIEVIFPLFLATTNFGFRQNKGFGHFLVEKCNQSDYKLNIMQWLIDYCDIFEEKYRLYELDICKNSHSAKSYDQMFEQIHLFNQAMKGGINFREYVPSFILKSYSKKLESGCMNENEKRYLKSLIVNKRGLTLCDKNNVPIPVFTVSNENVRYFRGVLGFADHYEFSRVMINDREHRLTFDVQYRTGDSKKKERKRFSSPLYYLPELDQSSSINNIQFRKVYILLNKLSVDELINDHLQAVFSLSKIDKIRSDKYHPPIEIEDKCVKLPSKFDIEDFIDSYCKEINKEKSRYKSKRADYKCEKIYVWGAQ